MILNKFSSVSLSVRLKTLSLQLFALSLFSCNKTANINANKAFVSFTHMAYQVGPLTLRIDKADLFKGIPYDSATGHLYATVTSQVSNTSILESSDTFLTGFSSFRQGAHYSIYVYDTIEAGTLEASAKNMIILQDNPPLNNDSSVSVRYMNFTPSSMIGLLLINTRQDIPFAGDTVVISPEDFVGANPNPAVYVFQTILAGNYNVFSFTDSIRARPDSSNIRFMGYFPINISSNYNFNLMGFANLDSGQYKFQFKPVALN